MGRTQSLQMIGDDFWHSIYSDIPEDRVVHQSGQIVPESLVIEVTQQCNIALRILHIFRLI